MLAGRSWNLDTAPNKKGILLSRMPFFYPGDDLLSHTVTHAVPSALKSLTSVFGKGTGVTSSLEPPKISFSTFNDYGIILSLQEVCLRSSLMTH